MLLAAASTPFYYRIVSFLGLFVMVGLAWLLSIRRKDVKWRVVLWAVGIQITLAVILLTTPVRGLVFDPINAGVNSLLGFSDAGARFVFGAIEPHQIIDSANQQQAMEKGTISIPMRTFAFSILPTIVFFSALMSILYHIGLMQRIVYVIAWIMQRTLKTSGAESLSAAANIFLGQTEAPLVIKPFVARMTNSELMAVMTGGFATVAGGVMAAYVKFLKDIPGIAGHLVVASVLSAPAALAVAKIVVPETEEPETAKSLTLDGESPHSNAIEAAANGATDGVKLAINVAAMLIAFVALVALCDGILGLVRWGDGPTQHLSLSMILGWVYMPLALVMGVPWEEAPTVGHLLGEKMVLTEFVAYPNLGAKVQAGQLSTRSALIASYALCGFANFASIGIQLGGIGAIAPNRMKDLAKLGVRSMLAGTLAAFMTACIAGMLS